MLASDVLVLGGPAVGKTHYAGQLLGRLRHDREGVLRIRPGGEDDLRKFEDVLRCLEEGRAAGHTPGRTWTRMRCQLQERGGEIVSIEWPDYAGERLASIVDRRELTPDWQTAVSAAGAWLLLIRLATLQRHEDLLTRPAGSVSRCAAPDVDNLDGSAWDDRARYVEMLQMLLFAAGRSTSKRVRSPRLAIVFSCWDELDETGPPERALAGRLPLLHAFVRNMWADCAWSAWGLSSLGRDLKPDVCDDDFVTSGPENFGYVIPPGEVDRNSDLTAPVAWLLDV